MEWVDNETAGLARAWFAVALSAEVGDEPVTVRVLGQDHRIARGDDRVVERYGLVWFAPEAPVCDIPDFNEWDDPSFDRSMNAPRRTTASAIQLTDNFLDATHLPFVHTGTFGVDSGAELPPHEVHRHGWRAWTTYVTPYRNYDDPLVATGEHPLVQEHHLFKELTPATTALIRLQFPLTGGVLAILFACLPEDRTSTRIFKMMARNDFGGDAVKLADAVDFEERVLDEDLRILEAYRDMRVPLDPRVEVHTRNDKLSLAYRRVLSDLVAADA